MSIGYAIPVNNFSPALKLPKTARAIIWMLLHCVALVLIMGVVRKLGQSGLSTYTIIFWQNVFSFTILTPICSMDGGFPKTKKLHLHAGRALSGISSGMVLFYGMSHVQLNVATAITFTGPLFSTIFAIIFLREKTYFSRIIGLCIGFMGVLVVLRPGSAAFDPNALYLILTAALWGCTDIFIKKMIKTESGRTMMFYRALLMLILTTPLGLYHWQEVTQLQLALLVLLALLDMLNFSTVTQAYRLADISVLMPFDFSRLIFSSIFAYIVFSETLDIYTVIGSSVIVFGTLFVVHSERKRSRIMSTETL